MRHVYSVEQCRAADVAAQQSVSETVLIDRASTAVARRAAAMLGSAYGARIVVLAGSGHNGADALWAGVKLQQRGAQVDVVVAGEPRDAHGTQPLQRLRALGARTVRENVVDQYDLAIDGLVGIGFTGELRWPELVSQLRDGPPVLAVDVPSGVNADTGAVNGAAVRADVTVTFGGLKTGLLVGSGAEHAGQIEVADIGLGAHLADALVHILDADDVARTLPEPPHESSKYTRGVVGVVAGSDRYTGAAALCCGAAVSTGAGMVRLFAESAAVGVVRAAWPEVVAAVSGQAEIAEAAAGGGKIDAWVVGPGMGTDGEARSKLVSVLASDRPVIVDADALTIAATDTSMLRRDQPTVVTPHLGEFERLTGMPAETVRSDRIGAARHAASELGVTVLLKGTSTLVANPDGSAFINSTGTPWLATAGTGDVLSGAIGTLLAAGFDAGTAAATGAWLHGLAGRLAADPRAEGAGPVTAGQVLDNLGAAIRFTR